MQEKHKHKEILIKIDKFLIRESISLSDKELIFGYKELWRLVKRMELLSVYTLATQQLRRDIDTLRLALRERGIPFELWKINNQPKCKE